MTGPEAGGVDPEAGAPDDTAGEPVGPSAWGVPVTESFGQVVLHPPVDRWLETVAACRDDGYVMAIDLTAVDYSAHPGRTDLPEGVQPERFEVVASLLSHATGDRVRLRTQVPESDPVVPSLFDLYPGTEAMEREAWDLLGVSFSGHPDHTRILMPEDWEGHPLRRDVAIGRIPVQFRDAPSTR
ncbi:MAG: NADH-quinone oxidoreductase subunit C [Actinobacteria bacterium]|jgi:NADH-quinone oxidoreductase subunit C|nr:NADH-quinone oxidoreductase subunit C [Actinomycetota bacterium]MBT4677820.1 NADH-quinone oxidoreductase subunit C [Acidimicrobiaceae bacterium]MBT5205822.1 NADH-quinone oxidoreductase subunit C [Acidimicrobiaceae bacterium]MBT5567435.1 NADH-quinone oxidoreductase subunit C [Acidimicrobiaceae bacterium]|tara:strand:+ start:1191 stop:1742 length:552 start_codon:yes stop_codon:yes gene_type:complete